MAVSGWFGLCSVGGQAPVQIKDFSVKVPDSATVMCACVCASGRRGRHPALLFFFFFFLPVIKNKPQLTAGAY